MEINLIARNKIADYIQQHPEAQTVFLNWLKNFPYMEAKSITRRIERSSPEEFTRASSPLNNGEYQIFMTLITRLKLPIFLGWARKRNSHKYIELLVLYSLTQNFCRLKN
ncbi:MAG: hypothetical protein ABI113_21065 [Mucilaginibacter sp.]